MVCREFAIHCGRFVWLALNHHCRSGMTACATEAGTAVPVKRNARAPRRYRHETSLAGSKVRNNDVAIDKCSAQRAEIPHRSQFRGGSRSLSNARIPSEVLQPKGRPTGRAKFYGGEDAGRTPAVYVVS